VTAPELLAAAGLEKGELDIFDGSPPCEPFSMAGQRESTWGKENAYSGTTQRSDDLFFEYARLVRGMKPRAFVAENVKGLVTGIAKGYYNEILAELKKCGYRVAARVLDAQWLGVPQHRERVIFVGIRNDLKLDPVFPTPLPHRYTVRDALPHLGRQGTDPNWDRRRRENLQAEDRMVTADRPSPTVTTVPGEVSGSSTMVGVVEDERLVHTVDHGQFSEQGDVTDDVAPTIQARRQQGATLPVELAVEGKIVSPRGGHGFTEKEQDLDEPAPTVTGGRGNGSGQTDGMLVEEGEARVLYDDGRTPETSGVRERPVDITDEPAPTVTTGGSDASHNVGANASHWKVEEDVWDEQIVGNDAFEPKFGPVDGPHPTVMASGARTSGELRSSKTKRRRRLTIDELKAICGFPPDYILTGSFAQQWERLGDAVPPPMMERIAKALEPLLLEAKR
jgi:DNA-cytosine methyltransferase